MAVKISIVIPTYNRSDFLFKTIDSLLKQTYDNFEIIIVDDGSTDGTQQKFSEYSHPKVKYFYKQNGERGAARNYGAARAEGDYINFFDSDDLAYNNHLQTAVEVINSNQQPAFFHLGYDKKNPDMSLRGIVDDWKGDMTNTIFLDNLLSCNGVFVRKDVAQKFPFQDDRTLAIAEDWFLWIELMAYYPLVYNNTVTSTIIFHDNRSIKEYNLDKIIARDELLIKLVQADQNIKVKFDKLIPKFVADRYTFIALIAVTKGLKKTAVQYLKKAVNENKSVIFSKRFLAVIKHLVI